ncbi:MAG: hypothetical protein QXQ48_02015 [Nitrososphaerota archaeon]
MENLEPDEIIYLIRVLLGFIVGLVCGGLPLYLPYAIMLGVGVYAISIPLVVVLYGGGGLLSRRTAITSGIGAYAFTWLMVWVLFYNLTISS